MHGGSLDHSVEVFSAIGGLLSKTASATILCGLRWGRLSPLHHQGQEDDWQVWRWTGRSDWSELVLKQPVDLVIHQSACCSSSLQNREHFFLKKRNDIKNKMYSDNKF